jgi:hypothetical protein
MVGRKMIKCYIDLDDLESAQSVMQSMSSARKNQPLSRYLRYSLALRRKDEAEGICRPALREVGTDLIAAQLALASLATIHNENNRLLFAAVSEAMQRGTKAQGAQLLQRLLDKYNGDMPDEINAFALLRYELSHSSSMIADWHRCTARLLLSALDEPAPDVGELCSRLCAVFKTGMRLTQTQATMPSLTSDVLLRECKWFEKNAYNAAVSHVHVWHLGTVIDLLQYSCLVSLSPQVSKFVSLMIVRSSTLEKRCRQLGTTDRIISSMQNMCRQFFILYWQGP